MAESKKKVEEISSVPEVRPTEIWQYDSQPVQEVSKYLLTPHLYYDELAHMEEAVAALADNAKIIEWGSGGSSTMFLENLKPNQRLVSIEHNPMWYDRVNDAVANHPKRTQFEYILMRMELNITKNEVTKTIDQVEYWGYGDPPEENPCFLEHYIDPYIERSDKKTFDADLYFVDGIARGAILAKIFINATNREAPVYIHDYKGREAWYEWIINQYSKKEIIGETLCKLTM